MQKRAFSRATRPAVARKAGHSPVGSHHRLTAGVLARGKAVRQLGELQADLACLLLGPLVAVDPDFHRPRAVGADLDECRAEARVPQVEVVDGDPAVLLVEGELRALARVGVPLPGDQHPLHFLGHPDRGNLRPPGSSRLVQVRLHHLDVAVGGLQRHHRGRGEAALGAQSAASQAPYRERYQRSQCSIVSSGSRLPAVKSVPRVYATGLSAACITSS